MKPPALFPPDFLRRLATLRLRAQRAGDPPGPGARGRAARSAAGFDLAGFRPYAPGEDPRRIDWAALARWDEALVRQMRDAEPREMRIVLDATPSMRFGEPSKETAARRLAGAVGVLAMASGRRVRLAGDPQSPASPAEWLRLVERAPRAASLLTPALLEELRRRAPREWVVLSDLYDAAALGPWIERLRRRGDPVLAVRVRAREDEEPPEEGALVRDSESGASRRFDPSSAAEFRRRRDAFDLSWAELAARLGVETVRADAGAPWESAIEAILAASGAAARRAPA